MTLSELQECKRSLGYSNETIARLSGVPLGTVQKIFAGITRSPRHSTLVALEKILRPEALPSSGNFPLSKNASFSSGASQALYNTPLKPSSADVVSDHAFVYGSKMQGEYTVEDYLALPDDQRYELIDGVLYDMASPSNIHQLILVEMLGQLYLCRKEHQINCRIYAAPFDVQLDKDNKTMVQPDVLICCHPENETKACLFGAPDLVIEILSPSTRKKDMSIKHFKYENAGVREYWLVDPDQLKVLVYNLEDNSFPTIYGFQEKVPVGITEGKCAVDFSEVYEEIKDFL